MKLTRRGFIEAVELPRELPLPYGFAVQPYLREIANRVDLEARPPRQVVINKGRSVGPTTAILEEVVPFAVDAFSGTEGDAERESKWTTSNNANPIQDILDMIAADSTPAAAAARRLDREYNLRRLARLWELAGYGHLVPPEYRSGK